MIFFEYLVNYLFQKSYRFIPLSEVLSRFSWKDNYLPKLSKQIDSDLTIPFSLTYHKVYPEEVKLKCIIKTIIKTIYISNFRFH